MLNEEKQIKCSKYLLGTFIVVAGIVIASYLFGRADVSDNGNGANNVGKQLQQLGANQQELIGEIREAAAEAGNISKQAGTVREGMLQIREQATDLTGEIREAGKIIKESREILATVRARGSARDRSEN